MKNQSINIIDASEIEERVDLIRRLMRKEKGEFYQSLGIPCENYTQYLNHSRETEYVNGLFFSLMVEYGISPKFFLTPKTRLFLKKGRATPLKPYILYYMAFPIQEVDTLELKSLVEFIEYIENNLASDLMKQLNTLLQQCESLFKNHLNLA